jgi:hypothetical protein
MKVRITVTADFEIDPKWIDEDGNLTHIADPAQVGGARPLTRPGPVLDVLGRLLVPPYFTAGSTARQLKNWDVEVLDLKR